jgi:hypothetical protein
MAGYRGMHAAVGTTPTTTKDKMVPVGRRTATLLESIQRRDAVARNSGMQDHMAIALQFVRKALQGVTLGDSSGGGGHPLFLSIF